MMNSADRAPRYLWNVWDTRMGAQMITNDPS